MFTAKNIRYLRRKQGWGQDKLAEALGYKSYTTIQKWESGVSEPPLKKVHAIAEVFGVNIDDIAKIDLESRDKGNLPATGQGEREIAEGAALKEWEKDALQMLRQLQPEELAREMAYLKERVGEKDKR